MEEDTYRMRLFCYNCGHQWYKDVKKGYRLHKSEDSCTIIEDRQYHKDHIHVYGVDIICPHCHTFSKIENNTQNWAPQDGYSGKINYEEDDPEKPGAKIFVPSTSYYFKPEYTFPKEIKLYEIYQRRQEQLSENKGKAYCYIIPDGLVQDILIHLVRKYEDQESKASLQMVPFFGTVELFKGFKKPEK